LIIALGRWQPFPNRGSGGASNFADEAPLFHGARSPQQLNDVLNVPRGGIASLLLFPGAIDRSAISTRRLLSAIVSVPAAGKFSAMAGVMSHFGTSGGFDAFL
jgi:hypothetical protein